MTFCTFVTCYDTSWVDWGLIEYGLMLFGIGWILGAVVGKLLK